MSNLRIPEYVKEFKCIGAECEDDCCHGWSVFIDKDSYDSYKEDKNIEMKEKYDKYLEKNENSTFSFDYGIMKMKENGKCPMQEDSGLCTIHKNYGEKKLSHTCWLYPRSVTKFLNSFEVSLLLSCPEVVRKGLLREEKMKFVLLDENTIPLERREIVRKIVDNKDLDSGYKKYLSDIRTCVIEILQNRSVKIEDRLIYLGLVINRIKKTIENKQLDSIKVILRDSIKEFTTSKIEISKEVTRNRKFQFEVLKSLFIARKNIADRFDDFTELYNMAKLYFDIENSDINESVKKYEESYLKYCRKFISDNEYIFENFLVNEVFQRVFPFAEDIFESYAELIISYTLLRFTIVLYSVKYKELNKKNIVEAIFRYARAFEHSEQFSKDMIKNLRESGFENLSYMAVLMKN